MTLDHATPITIDYPEDKQGSFESTWGDFVAANRDCPDVIADVEAQIAESNYAEIGGGGAPLLWIFA